MEKMTNKEFCDQLREVARAIGEGKQEEVRMPRAYIMAVLGIEESEKITQSYIRQIIERELKKYGKRPSVKTDKDEDGTITYIMSALAGEKVKVIERKDLPALQAKAVNKTLSHILDVIPNIIDLEGDQLDGARIAISRYQEMIRKMMVNETD